MADADRLAQRLQRLDTSTLSDALDSLGLSGVVTGLTAQGPPRRIAGRARTVELGLDDGRQQTRHLCTAAIEAASLGDVIVISHRATHLAAGWGGLLSVAAHAAGVAGVVIDGVCRDVDDYHELDFPVYARDSVPTSARGRVVEITCGTPVDIGAQRVEQGDWVIADRSGTVVIAAGTVEKVLDVAERLAAREALMAADIRASMPVTEVLGKDYESMLSVAALTQRHASEQARVSAIDPHTD